MDTQPMTLSKDRVKEIIGQAPKGTNPVGIVSALREKGYTLEGYPTTTTTPTPTPTEQPKGFLESASDVAGNVGAGLIKSGLGTLQGLSTLGQKLGNKALGLFGVKEQPIAELPKQLTEAQGTAQSIGKGVGDIAQYFIPGGAEVKAGKAIDELINVPKLVETFGDKAPLVQGIIKAVGKGGITGLSTGAVATAQKGELQPGAAIAGAVGGVIGSALEKLGKPIADSLQKSVLKVPPVKAGELGQKLDQTASWITDNIGAGTPTTQFNKAMAKTEDYENQLQSFLSKDAKDITIPRKTFIKKLNDLKGVFSDERDSLAIDKQINEAIKTIQTKQPDNIPIASLNKFKRSTFSNAYNKAGTKVVDWVESFIGNAAKTSIEDATKGMTIDGKDIGAFNQEYGNAIQATNLLKIAKEKQTSLSGKALLMLLGSPAGVVGEAAGLVAGGTQGWSGALKTRFGAMAKNAASTVPFVTKTGIGLGEELNQGNQQ